MLPTNDKERKALPILTFLTEYFPDAILELVRVSVAGNVQHNPELAPADIKWARGKSTDQLNTAFRHLWDHKTGTTRDADGQYHLAKAAWRVLAHLQLTIEGEAYVIEQGPTEGEPVGFSSVDPAAAAAAVDDKPIGSGEARIYPPVCQHGYTVCRVCQFS